MAKEEKLDWIYKSANSLVDREDYLLGRKVDKTLEQINEEEKEKKFVLPTPKNHVEHECIPPSIRDFNKIVLAEQVDLSAKLQEDPLVAIKKREEEARRQFLQNPVQLKKLQEALKQQQEKKHKNSKKKHSDRDLDEKLKEKFKLLRKNSPAIGIPKKTKKDSKDALNTILMHKFNALKDKLSEKDLQDILNGDVSDESGEDELKKKRKKKRKVDSSDSDTNKKISKSKKNRAYDSSDSKEKMKKRDSSSGRDIYEKRRKSDILKIDYSSERDSRKRSRSPNRKRQNCESFPRESSSEDKYGDKTGSIRKFERDRNRSRQSGSEESSKSPNKRKISRSMSNERKMKRTRDNREQQDVTKLTKNKYTRARDSSLDAASKIFEKSKNNKKMKDENSDTDLDERIMAKLRILRGEVEIKTKPVLEKSSTRTKESEDSSSSSDNDKYSKKKTILPAKPPYLKAQNGNSDSSSSESTSSNKKLRTLLPEKPPHLRSRSESSNASSSEGTAYNSRYIDSREDQKQSKLFGLVTSDGKKIALKKTSEHQKVLIKSFKKTESTAKPERKNVKKLSEKEKERLREEMMRNAEVRDKEREKNVQRYRERDKKEEEMIVKNFDADLVHSQLLKSAKHSSVEQRIKSNLNNIQRSSRHMDSNFSKR